MYNFFQRKQGRDETVEENISALKKLAITCKFGQLHDELIHGSECCTEHGFKIARVPKRERSQLRRRSRERRLEASSVGSEQELILNKCGSPDAGYKN
ncbi:hypothetical protein NDU88_003981 [Pleurodeles waltl]|uniref:Uncharacterized protein n=1 Tax=Pleurodeles waltl TaxID=8319 RepID=A0AAV7WQN1_PLEWA|nr:hypothetical protein NDU88_003981 [Pleurodeles waltl]